MMLKYKLYISLFAILLFLPKLASVLSCIDFIQIIIIIQQFMLFVLSFIVLNYWDRLCVILQIIGDVETLVAGLCRGVMKVSFFFSFFLFVAVLAVFSCMVGNIFSAIYYGYG
jgi:hypothetical protein